MINDALLSKALADYAKKQIDAKLFASNAEMARQTLVKFESLATKVDFTQKVLGKMKYYSGIMIKKTENDVKIKKREYQVIKASHSALKGATSIINGSQSEKDLFDRAMTHMTDTIGFQVGEMDRMLQATKEFTSTVDLQNAVANEKGLKLLEEFESKGLDTIFAGRINRGQD